MLALLADALYQCGDVPAAYDAITRADAADHPPSGGRLYLKAILQHLTGHPGAARQTFDRAEALPSRPVFWDTLHVEEARQLLWPFPSTRNSANP